MGEDTDRPQDVGRAHRKAGAPGPETARILEAYRNAMRAELEDTLAELRPEAGQLTIAGGVKRPELAERVKLWNLAIVLARELGSSVDIPAPEPGATVAGDRPSGATRGRAPRLTKRDRASLG